MAGSRGGRLLDNLLNQHEEILTRANPASISVKRIKRVLITNIWFRVFSGSEIVCLELYEFFTMAGYEVEIVANYVSPKMQDFCSDHGVVIFSAEAFRPDKEYDLIWINHEYLPLSLLEHRKNLIANSQIIFNHMSPFEPLEFSFFPELESEIANMILANSIETQKELEQTGINSTKISVFDNPAPSRFKFTARDRTELNKIMVVSNHPPSEILDLIYELKTQGFEVKHFGMGSEAATNARLTEFELGWADAVVTIGKTVQYAILNKLPVYIYDIYGGDGWLDSVEKLELSATTNFTGRPRARLLTHDEIKVDLIANFKKAAVFASNMPQEITDKYDLNKRVSEILEFLSDVEESLIERITPKSLQIWKKYISLISRETHKGYENRQLDLEFSLSSSIAERDGAIAERDGAIAERDGAIAERDGVLNSRIWKISLPYRKFRALFKF